MVGLDDRVSTNVLDMRVISVNTGRIADAAWAKPLKRTAIDKRPVSGRVPVRTSALGTDEHADIENHGDLYKAVYAYAREDYDWWQGRLERELRSGMFGENLTLSGVDVTGAMLGERWRVGSAVVEVTGPRIPCGVFRNWMDEPRWVKRFTEARRPGAYLRVVEEGEVAAGDPVEIVRRPADGVDLAESVAAFHGDVALLRRVIELPGHSPGWDERAQFLRVDVG